MGYCDYTNADIFALTRQRREEITRAGYLAKYGETRVYRLSEMRRERPTIKERARRIAYAVHPNGPHERYLSASMFKQILALQEHRCYLCAETFTNDDGPTQDHVVPRSRGGGNSGNVLLAHMECNNDKGDRMPTAEELEYLEAIKAKFVVEAPAALWHGHQFGGHDGDHRFGALDRLVKSLKSFAARVRLGFVDLVGKHEGGD